jgi:hypothetical protein
MAGQYPRLQQRVPGKQVGPGEIAKRILDGALEFGVGQHGMSPDRYRGAFRGRFGRHRAVPSNQAGFDTEQRTPPPSTGPEQKTSRFWRGDEQ